MSIITFTSLQSWAVDPHDALDALLTHDWLPRVLSSDDISGLRPTDPQPLFAPSADFNNDKNPDIAISGHYDLKEGPNVFFLLVAQQKKSQFKKLFYQEYDKPVFLHWPGTTGEGDPNDQVFSATFCRDCNEGVDFYWNAQRNQFTPKPWTEKTKRTQKVIVEPPKEIPPDIIDKALRVAGEIDDVKEFTAQLKKENRPFAVRVEWPPSIATGTVVNVVIYEKKGKKEDLYDRITVDTDPMRVIGRKKKTLNSVR